MRWWDTANQRMQTARLEAVTLQVAAAEVTQANINTSPTAAGATEPQDSGAVATTSQLEAELIETSERSLLDELRASRALQLSLAINGLMLLVLLVLLLRRPTAAKAIRRDDSDRHSARLELKQQLSKIERAVKALTSAPCVRESLPGDAACSPINLSRHWPRSPHCCNNRRCSTVRSARPRTLQGRW